MQKGNETRREHAHCASEGTVEMDEWLRNGRIEYVKAAKLDARPMRFPVMIDPLQFVYVDAIVRECESEYVIKATVDDGTVHEFRGANLDALYGRLAKLLNDISEGKGWQN